MRDNKKKNLM